MNTSGGLLLIFGKFRGRIFYYFSSTVAVIHRCSLKRSILKNFAKLTGKHLSLQIVSLPSETSFVFFRYSGERQW